MQWQENDVTVNINCVPIKGGYTTTCTECLETPGKSMPLLHSTATGRRAKGAPHSTLYQ